MSADAMTALLHPPSRSERKQARNRRCPGCGKRFASRPALVEHFAVRLLVVDTGVSEAEAVSLWRAYGTALVGTDPDTGERRMVLPDDNDRTPRGDS